MEFYLTSFGLHNPYIKSEIPEHCVFPICSYLSNGIDLDYTSLLLGQEYYLDLTAYEFINSREKEFLAPMANTLSFLKSEGFLRLVDVQGMVAENVIQLKQKVESLTKHPEVWIQIFQKQWRTVSKEFSEFHNLYGTPSKHFLNTCNYPVYNYLYSIGEADNIEKMAKITNLLNGKKVRYSSNEFEALGEIIKPLIAQILINDLVRSKIGKPILDWDDNESYYNELYLYDWQRENKESLIHSESHKLFDIIIPSLKPKNIQEVVRFIQKDRAVMSLRNELWSAIENNEELSHAWYESFTNRVIKKDLNYKNNQKKFRWLGIILNFLPTAGIVNAAIEVGKNLSEDAIEESVLNNFEWFYTLQNEAARRKV